MPFAKITTAAIGSTAIVLAVPGRTIRVFGYVLVAAGAVAVKWQSAAVDLTGVMTMATGVPLVCPTAPLVAGERAAYLETAAGEALNLNLSGGVQVSGHLEYMYRTV